MNRRMQSFSFEFKVEIINICAQKTVGYPRYMSMLYNGQIKKDISMNRKKNPNNVNCLGFMCSISENLYQSFNHYALLYGFEER